jgi:hypothetical protein
MIYRVNVDDGYLLIWIVGAIASKKTKHSICLSSLSSASDDLRP